VNKAYAGIIVLAAIALVFSVLIESEKLGSSSATNVCSAISGSNCKNVQYSMYGRAFGFDNAYLGIAGFLVLIILAIMQLVKFNTFRFMILNIGIVFAGLMAVWFLHLQFNVLHTICSLCIVVDIASLIMLVISFFEMWRIKHHNI